MDNTAQCAIDYLRNRVTGSEMRQLSDADLHQFESICHHWQAMAEAERKSRASTIKNDLPNLPMTTA